MLVVYAVAIRNGLNKIQHEIDIPMTRGCMSREKRTRYGEEYFFEKSN